MNKVVGILALLTVTACATSGGGGYVSESESYARKISASPTLAANADYFRNRYGSSDKDQAFYGYYAISTGSILVASYDETIKKPPIKGDHASLLQFMRTFRDVLEMHALNTTSVWNTAIQRNVKSKYSFIDFSEALSIVTREHERLGVFNKLTIIKAILADNVASLPKERYPQTLNMYAVLSQLSALIESPKGSLVTFNASKNALISEFEKSLALSLLEK